MRLRPTAVYADSQAFGVSTKATILPSEFSKTEEKYPEVIFQIYISNFQSILPAFREYFHGQFYLH